MPPCFAELRAHSGFSFGDGSLTPEKLAAFAAHLGYTSLGLTDTADLGGVVRFAEEARRHNLKPVIGAEFNVEGHTAAFLARTEEGFHNLAALVTRSRVGDLHLWNKDAIKLTRGRPRLTWSQVAERSAGLHALTGPASGEIAALILSQRKSEALYALSRWRDVFNDRLAVEVQLHHTGGDETALAGALIELAGQCGVPWVVCQDPRYIDGDTRLVHDMLTALRCDMDLDTALAKGVLHPNGEWRLHPPEEIAKRWAGREEGIAESERIAAECDFKLGWLRPPLPSFPKHDGLTDDEFLRRNAFEGAHQRWGKIMPREAAQLEHELGVIARLGFSGFFLVMWDAVRFARHKGILCQGRGSAANSAVAYCLGITAVDPVMNGLLFERFLSEIRVDGQTEAPDIDLDIEHDRREEVLDYVYGRYARAHSAITCIVQTYRAPNAVLDSMRALGYPPEQSGEISKRLHRFDPDAGAGHMQNGLARQFSVDLETPRGRALLRAVRTFEGLPRLRSTHVGGFVLSSAPLGDYMPIEHTTMGRTIIQFDKDDLDAVGVPKFDFLGLGALSLVRRSFDAIEKRTGTRPEIYRLPVNDRKTYDLIASGETIGTFQIESRAQIASILHTKPERMYDIVVQIALIRPGPIQAKFVHPYTNRRLGREEVKYADERLRPILARTYGIPIFQEQAMSISMALGGFSAAEADHLRRTMGNIRKKGKLEAVLEKLRLRMIANDVKPEVASHICEDLISFANYGFPESHAWSFALIAYASAYLKAHHPAEFYMGILNSWPMGFYPPSTLIHDARRHGVEVRQPCMRDGDWECTVEETADFSKPALRVGWRHVRGLADKVLDRLRAARAEAPFTSIDDVVRRGELTRAEALTLARADVFAVWEQDRRCATWEALRVAGDSLPLAPAGNGMNSPRPLSRRDLIFMDYFALGLSARGHPMEHLRPKLSVAGVVGSRDFAKLKHRESVLVAGLVTVRQRPESAGGTIFLLLEDEHGFMNVIVPSKLVDEFAEPVKFATFIMVRGRFERDGAVMNVVGEKFRELKVKGLAHQSHDFH